MRAAWLLLVVLIFTVIASAASASSPMKIVGASALSKMSSDFVSSINSKPSGEMVRVIIKYKPEAPSAQGGLLRITSKLKVSDKVRLYGGKVNYEYSIIPGVSASVPAGMVEALASDSRVEAIYPVKTYYINRLQATPLIKADTAALNYGVNGTGINISIIDTGIYNHPEFQNPSRIIAQKCYCINSTGGCCANGANSATTAYDDFGHGTHVAGIAAGQGNASYGYGVATNANLFAVKVCDSTGTCYDDDIIKGVEWSVQNGANIISMSLGGFVANSCYDESYLPDWVDNLTAQGVLFVIAAGNNGTAGPRHIESPGCAKSALTVGASDKNDNIASYSSLGATLDNRTKPDVVATGLSITSTVPPGPCTSGSPYYQMCAASIYASASGTSMATPFVSGEAALIMQRYRQVFGYMPDPALVKAIIMTGVSATSQRNNIYGSGRIDVMSALSIINLTTNGSITHGQLASKIITAGNGTLIATLYWPENNSIRNNLDLIVGNSTVNFTQATDANDTVEQVTLFNIQGGSWYLYVNGTNVTGSQRYFLAWLDSIPPYWHDSKTITTAVYNSSNLSHFNISWSDNGLLSSVWAEGNWSGSAQNYSMAHYGGGAYSYNTTLPDGTFYWRSWANDTAGNLNFSDSWIFNVTNIAPNITDASIFPYAVLPGDNITVYANASDYSLDAVWFNISNSSGFGAMTFMQNASARFNATYNTSSLAIGLYNITVYANDTRNNVSNISAGILNVTVPRNITISLLNYLSSQTNASITIFYNGTSSARNYTANATDLTLILPECLWDIRISSTFNFTLFNVNTSANVTGNATLDVVPNSNVTLSGFIPVEIIAVESGLNFTNATIAIPNSSISPSLNITVLACHSWNISNRSCDGAWENATANSSISAGLVSLYTLNLSAFAVMRNTTCGDGFVDAGETTSTCCQDTGCPSGQSCSSSTHACYTPPTYGGGGGSGGGGAPPKRKSLTLAAPDAISMLKGSIQTLTARLLNNGEVSLTNVRLSFSSSCTGCAIYYNNESFTLDINESRDVAATISAENAGLYGILMTASSSQGTGNSTSAILTVFECEPGSMGCDGPELWSCSSDGMALNKTACESECVNGACASKPLRILNGTSTANGGNPQNDYFLIASVIIILFLMAVIIYLARQ